MKLPLESRGPSDPAAVGPLARMASLPGWISEDDPPERPEPRLRFRTIWISDLHLGTPGCNAELLYDFLRSTECDTLYLVGDIVDAVAVEEGLVLAAAPQRHRPLRAQARQERNRGDLCAGQP
jgi:hypothetical protein